MDKPHGIKKLPSGQYIAWSGDEKSEHQSKRAAESWVKRRKHYFHSLPRDDYHMSFEAISQVMGISKVRVRQLDAQAITKLRAALMDDAEFRFWLDLT